jgi:thiamine pyrophosphate-dependent acetolactate synthase large subunit-like protein
MGEEMSSPATNLLYVHQAIAKCLVENGVDTMFGLMGDANMFMVNSFINDFDGNFVPSANEAGATMMAIGYAYRSGKPGVCSVTHGPAMTNTVTGLIEGVKASVPLVLICGDTPVGDREHLQDVAQRDIVKTTGAGFEQLRSPATIAQDVARTLVRAQKERRPIVLNVPLEFDWQQVTDFEVVPAYVPEARGVVGMTEDLENAIGIIAAARRPLVLAGRGASTPEAKEALLKLAERIGAPLATSLKGKDLFRGEEYDIGVCGTLSKDGATETIMEADCLIAFGASLNKYTLAHGGILKGKRVIQVNLEQTEVGKNIKVDAGLVGDPAQVADLIVHWLDEAEIPSSQWRGEEIKARIAADRVEPEGAFDNGDGTVDYLQVLRRLNKVLPQDRVLVTDSGRFMVEAFKNVDVPDPRSLLVTHNFGSIGLAVSYGIGASFVDSSPVVVFSGDGGFMNGGMAEFNTAVRKGADVIVIVFNDGVYGAEHYKFDLKQMDPTNIGYDWPDFGPVATALGGEGLTLRSEADWPRIEEAIRNRTKPLLIDIKIDPDKVPCEF